MHCHRHLVSHRDLKPDNILITPAKEIKLIDFAFGMKQLSKTSRHFGFVGTLNYMAPEIVQKLECLPMPTDMWALGVILIKLATGKSPFQGRDLLDIFLTFQLRKGLK